MKINKEWTVPTKTSTNAIQTLIGGTSYYGYTIIATGEELIAILGSPNSEGDEYKISTEWVIINNRVKKSLKACCLYDWKISESYDSEGMTKEDIRGNVPIEWHIGGRTSNITFKFKTMIEDLLKKLRRGDRVRPKKRKKKSRKLINRFDDLIYGT